MKLNKKPKRSPRDILKRNILKGKLGERVAKKDYRKNGFDLSVTGKGSDFIAEKREGDTICKEYVDVKTGKAKLSKKQKQTRNQLKKKNITYREYRITDVHLKYQIESDPDLQEIVKKFEGEYKNE